MQREILDAIERWHRSGTELDDEAFDDLALRVFAFQLERNEPYARYCERLGVGRNSIPDSWERIPPVPADAYKEARLATFEGEAALVFETSGTTQGIGGRHYMESAELYDAALLAGFDRFVLADGARLRYLNIVPNPQERPRSSLGYMMGRVSERRGDGKTGWFLREETFLADEFFEAVESARRDARSVCIATTAFALVAALDAAESRGLRLPLPHGSRIMETGGFKGRTRVVSREELYARASSSFGIAEDSIVAEYGMTELASQWYGGRLKAAPTWLRARAVGPDGATLPDGVVGALAHVDLANLSSCIAVQTEDLGATFGRELVLIGRESGAELRGCSLDAESLGVR